MAVNRGGSIVQGLTIKYKHVVSAVCLLFFLSMTMLSAGQTVDTVYENEEDDTIYAEPPAEEEESGSNYFIRKGMTGAGMDSIRLRHLPDSFLSVLKASEDFQYGPKKKEELDLQGVKPSQEGNKTTSTYVEPHRRRERISQQQWFQTLLWILIIGGFFAFLVIWLSGSNINLFRNRGRQIGDDEMEENSEDIFNINYQRDIDKAAAAGNYRLAIRLMFLRSLKKMSERNIIRYKQDSTNLDYLMQISSSEYYNDFFRITRNYEYSWYGLFNVREDMYRVIRTEFDQFDRKLN